MKFFSKIFRKITKNQLLFLIAADILLISLSIWLGFLLRFEGKIPAKHILNLQSLILLALIFSPPLFYWFKLYSFSWSYVSTQELISLFNGTFLSFLLSGVALLIFRDSLYFSGFPRSTLFISYFLIFLFCGAIRFSKRIWPEIFQGRFHEEKEKTLIVGAGDAGEQILRSVLSPNGTTRVVGFIDDNENKQGVTIHGKKVLGKIDDIPKIVRGYNITEGSMIIALPSDDVEKITKAVKKGREAKLKKIKIVPPITEVISGKVPLKDITEFKMEDLSSDILGGLLRRELLKEEPLNVDTELIKNLIQKKVVLVTGAAGSIGSELSRRIARFDPSLLLLLDQDETGIFNILGELTEKFPKLKIFSEIGDIQDKKKIKNIFSKFKPNIVFHAAAYKHVPLMEKHPDEAIENNIFGTKNVADAALKYGAEKFIFISTDKAVKPTSVMGATKRIGEMICRSLNQKDYTKFISVRFGNVLDSRGSVIPIFREKIKKREQVEVTDEKMKRYFMLISEACLLVMQAGAMGEGGEVFVLDMGKPIMILDLAKTMIRLSGLEPDKDIPIVITEPRPGEKFFELTAEEGTIATQHQKIFMAKLSNVNKEKLDSGLKNLKTAVEKGDKENIKNILKKLIPFYRPRR